MNDAELYAELFGEDAPDLQPPGIGASGRPMARIRSRFGGGRVVDVDAYAPNALLLEAEQAVPEVYEIAMVDAPPPTLFATGDLPPFLASGLDPTILNELPWQMRHAAAATESRAAVLQMVEDAAEHGEALYAMDDDGQDPYAHPGREAYERRVRSWLMGRSVRD